MKRLIFDQISADLTKKKMILVSGPRQSGKTTLAKSLSASFNYLNYDSTADRKKLLKYQWDRTQELTIFDEVHKMKKWKQWLKGVYDTETQSHFIVTGSAKMDVYKKVGDSMAGRYFHFHLFPLDLKELRFNRFGSTEENLNALLERSGFPEPFLSENKAYYKRWRRTHLDVIIKQDMIETESIKRISDLTLLVDMMTERVGLPISYNSMREDLSTDDKTIKRWFSSLENSYVLFKVTPYFKNFTHAIKKSPKYYFFDYPRANDEGAVLENFVALSLLKEISLRNDLLGENYTLHYLRDKTDKEVDFLICNEKKPQCMIEVKTSDLEPSSNFEKFEAVLKKSNPSLKKIQLVKNCTKNFSTRDGVLVTNLAHWLEKMEF